MRAMSFVPERAFVTGQFVVKNFAILAIFSGQDAMSGKNTLAKQGLSKRWQQICIYSEQNGGENMSALTQAVTEQSKLRVLEGLPSLQRAVREVGKHGDFIVDLRQMRFLLPGALSALLELRTHIAKSGGHLVIIADSPDLLTLFRLLKMKESFIIVSNADEANKMLKFR